MAAKTTTRSRNGYNVYLNYLTAFALGRDIPRGGPTMMRVGGPMWSSLPPNRKLFWHSLARKPQTGTAGKTVDSALVFIRHVHAEMRSWIQERRQTDGYVSDSDDYDWQHEENCDVEIDNVSGILLPYDEQILRQLREGTVSTPKLEPVPELALPRDEQEETRLLEEAINLVAQEMNVLLPPFPWRTNEGVDYHSQVLTEWRNAVHYFQTDEETKKETPNFIRYLGRLYVNGGSPGAANKKLYKRAIVEMEGHQGSKERGSNSRDGSSGSGSRVPNSGKAKAIPKARGPAMSGPPPLNDEPPADALDAVQSAEFPFLLSVYQDQGPIEPALPTGEGFVGEDLTNVPHNTAAQHVNGEPSNGVRRETTRLNTPGPSRGARAADIRKVCRQTLSLM